MQINSKSIYFKLTPSGFEETTKRKERASFKEMTKFFKNSLPLDFNQTKSFVDKWPTIKAQFEQKKLESKYGYLGKILRYFCNLFFKDSNQLVNELDSQMKQRKLECWLLDPSSTGNKQEAVNRIRRCQSNLNHKRLDLRDLGLTSLPPCLGEISHLEELHLDNNQLQSLPESLGQLANLKYLYLSNNLLHSLPENIGQLVNLKYLSLGNNQLHSLPESLGQLVRLEYLYLTDNLLHSLPENIGQLVNLKYLLLSNNQLHSLPENIGQLVNLKYLLLSNNQLHSLPESLGQFVKLKYLYLGNNQLRSLPESLGNLARLTTLDLDSNPLLENLPLSLGNLPRLLHLSTSDTNIPRHIAEAILDACQALRGNAALNSLPVLLNKWLNVADPDKKISRLNLEKLNNNLTNEEKGHLYEWLIRLERTRDFKDSQRQLAKTTIELLEALLISKKFRGMFFSQVEVNNTACEDRAAMAYNEIYLSYCLCVKAEKLSEKEKILLMLRGAKTQALIKALSKLISAHQQAHAIEQESVEIYLYYLTSLRERLDLLLAIQNMRYAVIGPREWINTDELVAAVEKNTIKELTRLPIFEKYLSQAEEKDLVRQELENLNHAGCELLEKLDENSAEWFKKNTAIKKEIQAQRQALLIAWTQKLLKEHEL